MTDTGQTPPLERYFRVLEVVAAAHDRVGLAEIAAATGLPKPTVHRLTRTLSEAGALEIQSGPHKTYGVGRRLWRLLYLGMARDRVASSAQLVCDDLARRLGETCYAVRLGEGTVASVARSVPDQGHRLHVLPGSTLPAHAASSAKAVLAFQPEPVIEAALAPPLPALTPHTTTDPAAVRAELAEVRRTGYAVCDQEIDEGVMAYAVPVPLPNAGVLYALGVTGPSTRMGRHPAEIYVHTLREGAGRFADLLEGRRAPA